MTNWIIFYVLSIIIILLREKKNQFYILVFQFEDYKLDEHHLF